MDLDGDGHLDVLSGSYPGELYLFRGLEDGSFAEAETLEDADGEPVNLGAAAAVYAADWDADGDLDLVVGDIRGHVWLLPNGSGGTALELGEASKLEVDGETIRVPRGDAGPVLADWDGNGTLDLIVGCGDGSVRLYANGVSEGPPELSAPDVLLPAPEGGMQAERGAPVRCGARAKPCVFDVDGDGRLDLLVGDVLIQEQEGPEPSEEDRAHLERLERKRDLLVERYIPAVDRVTRAVFEQMGILEEGESTSAVWNRITPEQRKAFGELRPEILKRDIEAAAIERLFQAISRELHELDPPIEIHGHVWVLRRG